MEKTLWKLGIPVTTRHREVAPNQYEIAPIYEPTTLATDHNMITMEVMHRVAAKFGLAALLHEKPFKGVNGSGKHNNWSLGSNKKGSLFSPGSDPVNNLPFLLTLAATIRGVDLHQDVLRFSIAGAGNDHRLGANEAPPAIFSIYLGDDLEKVVYSIIAGDNRKLDLSGKVINFNVPFLPEFTASPTDRNRTSPFAFTGNKFEVRAVGSSQTPAFSNIVLNTMMAESFEFLATVIETKVRKGASTESAVREAVREIFTQHQRIIFNGNGYSQEWQVEANKRGLLNLRTTPDVLEIVENDKNITLFETTNVLNREEFSTLVEVSFDTYSKRISLEGFCLANMANQKLLPAAVGYVNELNQANLTTRAQTITALIEKGFTQANELYERAEQLEHHIENDVRRSSRFAVDNVIPQALELRETLDRLERYVPKNLWPIPNYQDILFHQHI